MSNLFVDVSIKDQFLRVAKQNQLVPLINNAIAQDLKEAFLIGTVLIVHCPFIWVDRKKEYSTFGLSN
jgi:flagellar biosynthesis protein FliP